MIDWLSLDAWTVRTTSGAALNCASPPCDAVSVQVPVPLVIITMPDVSVQTPEAAMVTDRPELAVALTGKVELSSAGLVRWWT